MMTVHPLQGPFGVEVVGVQLTKDSDTATVRQIIDLVHRHHVAVIRAQFLPPADYAAFGRHWGDPIIFFLETHRNDEFPELIEIKNSPSLAEAQRDYALHWHSDSSYQAVPSSATMLNAVETPLDGGDTLFVDMAAAYDALPADKKAAIEGLQVRHRVGAGKRSKEEVRTVAAEFSEAELKRVEPCVHPLVIRHPVTGRTALYAVAGSAYGIVGMSDEAGEALLDELKHHATQERFRLKVKAHAGDILIWDNFATMHSATKIEYSADDGKRRRMLRISVTGLPLAWRDLAQRPATTAPAGSVSTHAEPPQRAPGGGASGARP